MPSNKFIKPSQYSEVEPPYVLLNAATYIRSAHQLFNYETQDANNKYFVEQINIDEDCNVYHNIQSNIGHRYLDYEQDISHQDLYICTVVRNYDDDTFTIISADASEEQPETCSQSQNPDLLPDIYLVVNDLELQSGVQGYPLQVGTRIKLGKSQLIVTEIRNNEYTQSHKQASFMNQTKNLFKVVRNQQKQEEQVKKCKICLSQQDEQEDPLINPCKCRGSCQFMHVGCLSSCVNSKIKQLEQSTANLAIYSFDIFQCELCKNHLPKFVQMPNGTILKMFTFQKPSTPYLVLQSLPDKNKSNNTQNVYVISYNGGQDEKRIFIGRGANSQIRIDDPTISSTHSEIRYEEDMNLFYIKDLHSKFGTLVKFIQEFPLQNKLRLQWGRTRCFDFNLQQEPYQKYKIQSGPSYLSLI